VPLLRLRRGLLVATVVAYGGLVPSGFSLGSWLRSDGRDAAPATAEQAGRMIGRLEKTVID
jgi:hypothetical protein